MATPSFARRPMFPTASYGEAAVESSGFYTDLGGYTWHWDARTGRLTMMTAPGGGARKFFVAGNPSFAAIFKKIVAGKPPWTDNKVIILAIGQSQGGAETRGTAVDEAGTLATVVPAGGTAAPATTAAPAKTRTRTGTTQVAAAPPVAPPVVSEATPLWKNPWLLGGVVVAALVVGGLVYFSSQDEGEAEQPA